MSNQTLATRKVMIGSYELCITTRSVGDSFDTMHALTLRTIGAWMKLVSHIEKPEPLPEDLQQASVESRYITEMQKTYPEFTLADAWGDARVTVWDTYRSQKQVDFHLNSDDIFQTALDVWWAQSAAIEEAQKIYTPQSTQIEKPQPAPANEQPAIPKGNGSNGQSSSRFLTRKQMLEQLHEGDTAPMKIAKVMLRSQDDTRYYELYPMLGNGNIGKYAELRVYTDNEVALNNGVLKVLNDIGLKTGKGMESTWIVECKVAKNKKGELDTYPQAIKELES